mmetsp:Transcript_41193/g.81290  ORF Transcript_41193/g.81290 Transcript_41193/m.81290 type:complete len:97 (+) Transcript_41193:733-1023(+)
MQVFSRPAAFLTDGKVLDLFHQRKSMKNEGGDPGTVQSTIQISETNTSSESTNATPSLGKILKPQAIVAIHFWVLAPVVHAAAMLQDGACLPSATR